MTQPTDAQIAEYLATLEKQAPIYVAILRCFLQKSRTRGYVRRLGASVTAEAIKSSHPDEIEYGDAIDYEDALEQMIERGLLIQYDVPIRHFVPTELCERILARMVQGQIIQARIPDLPAYSWSM